MLYIIIALLILAVILLIAITSILWRLYKKVLPCESSSAIILSAELMADLQGVNAKLERETKNQIKSEQAKAIEDGIVQ